MDPLDQLCAHVRYRLGGRVHTCTAARVDELTRLALRHWPHAHLEAVEMSGGMHHKAADHAMALLRAQVREQWEARHGVGPMWQLLLAGAVEGISIALSDLWWSDPRWRTRLKEMGKLTREAK